VWRLAELEALAEDSRATQALRRLAAGIAGVSHADDIVQTIFERMVRMGGGFLHKGTLFGYVWKAVEHEAVDQAKRQERTKPMAPSQIAALLPVNPHPEHVVLEDAEVEAVRQAIFDLPPKLRRAVFMALYGWSQTEAASHLGITPRAAGLRKQKAIERIRWLVRAWRAADG
jgi:RNA polymerase sigma factor (sigma-70 family)